MTMEGSGVPAQFIHEIEPSPKATRAVREVSMRTHQCPECPKTFKSARQLGPHRNKAHGFRREKKPAKAPASQRSRKPRKVKTARRPATGAPLGFQATLARLKTKRDDIDAAIRTLEKVEELLA